MEVFKTVITILLVIISIILTIVVLMQEGKQEGLGSLAGGSYSSDTYWSKNKGRSKEGRLARFTTILAVLFFVIAFVINLKFMN